MEAAIASHIHTRRRAPLPARPYPHFNHHKCGYQLHAIANRSDQGLSGAGSVTQTAPELVLFPGWLRITPSRCLDSFPA